MFKEKQRENSKMVNRYIFNGGGEELHFFVPLSGVSVPKNIFSKLLVKL